MDNTATSLITNILERMDDRIEVLEKNQLHLLKYLRYLKKTKENTKKV